MWVSIVAPILIIGGAVLLVFGTLPVENRIDGTELVVKFVIGKKVIDVSEAVVMPVPDEVNNNIIRVGGTRVGRKHSGKFKNIRTATKYQFYLTGKGERTYFEIDGDKYLVDGVSMNARCHSDN